MRAEEPEGKNNRQQKIFTPKLTYLLPAKRPTIQPIRSLTAEAWWTVLSARNLLVRGGTAKEIL
jgi:hypothetical protein